MKGGHEGREGGDMMGANIKRGNVKRNRFKGWNASWGGRGGEYVKGRMQIKLDVKGDGVKGDGVKGDGVKGNGGRVMV